MNARLAGSRDDLRHYIETFAHEHTPFTSLSESRLLIACSGGADSLALALMCWAYEIDCGLAYIEHGINASTAECEVIVKTYASELDLPFFTAYLDMAENNLVHSNVEATARTLRYNKLEQLRSTHGYHYVATAHHRDDVAETFLINLIRGAGSGVASVRDVDTHLMRPLLQWRKKELLDIVTHVGMGFFDDEMNYDARYVRNRIRHEVLPLLDDIAARDTTELIARASSHIARDARFLREYSSSLWPRETPDTSTLRSLDEVLATHALRAWITGYPPSDEEMQRIFQVVRHEIPRTQLSGNRTIWRREGVLYQDVTPAITKDE